MPTLLLPGIPADSTVFLDANILIYGLTKKSQQCVALLQRCARQEIFGISSFSTLAEVTHRLMIMEAVSEGLAPTAKAKDYLDSHPQIVTQLHEYWTLVSGILAMNLLLVPVDEAVTRRAHLVRQAAGLLTNDSLIVAAMIENEITFLASQDQGFDTVREIVLCRADDL